MEKRSVPSVDQAARAAIEWYRGRTFRQDEVAPDELIDFFLISEDDDHLRLETFVRLIVPHKALPGHLRHTHFDLESCDLSRLFDLVVQAGMERDPAREAFEHSADFDSDDRYNSFADIVAPLMKEGGIYVLLCECCRDELRH